MCRGCLFVSFKSFMEAFCKKFRDPQTKISATMQLLSLKETSDVKSFNALFERLTDCVEYEESEALILYSLALLPIVSTAMTSYKWDDSLEAAMYVALEVGTIIQINAP
jgi:Retrotransposon gag protein